MKPYTKQDIISIYGDLIKSAQKNYVKHQYKSALNDIIAAARWMYNLNAFYTDLEVEHLLGSICDDAIDSAIIRTPKSENCVLLDSYLIDNRGLSQQYLHAMMANDKRILVIYTSQGGEIGKDTLSELKNYEKTEILAFNKKTSLIKQTQQIVDAIVKFAPAHMFLHITPWDVVALMACHAVSGVTKYNINLTDHAFWLGASFIDYNLEFRPYGMTVSLEKRGLKQMQLLALPYYPITPQSVEFLGFPTIPSDAIIVLTGGAIYKMLGKDDIFFHILECILGISSNLFILVAGIEHDQRFDEKVAKLPGRERILQIGIRKDIDAVFEHCDLFLGTYPMMGGLMTQYAAKHGKPVIAYHEKGDAMNTVEEVLNYYQSEFRSFSDLETMTLYAKQLVADKDFREKQGRLLKDGMMTEDRFNKEFSSLLINHVSSFDWKLDSINYDAFFERYLDLENSNGYMATGQLVSQLKFYSYIKIKGYTANIIEECLLKLVRFIRRFI